MVQSSTKSRSLQLDNVRGIAVPKGRFRFILINRHISPLFLTFHPSSNIVERFFDEDNAVDERALRVKGCVAFPSQAPVGIISHG